MPKRTTAPTRELRLVKSTLQLGLERDVSGTETGKKLQKKGFVSQSGRTTKKGKVAIGLL